MNKLAAQWILEAEGGLVDNPNDPGGVTKYGISKAAFPDLDIVNLTPEQAIAIYASDYWEPAKCPALPQALALVHFDAAVNCGVGQAARFLQQAVGVSVDGIVGPLTIAAAWKTHDVVSHYLDTREAFYRKLAQANPAEGVFLDGWLNRLANLKAFVAAIKKQWLAERTRCQSCGMPVIYDKKYRSGSPYCSYCHDGESFVKDMTLADMRAKVNGLLQGRKAPAATRLYMHWRLATLRRWRNPPGVR
jgi:lysozyme family protein